MVTNVELSSEVKTIHSQLETLTQDLETFKLDMKQLMEKMQSLEAKVDALGELKATLKRVSTTLLGKKPLEASAVQEPEPLNKGNDSEDIDERCEAIEAINVYAEEGDESELGCKILQPSDTTQRTKEEEEDWRRTSNFFTRVRCNGKLCMMAIDSGGVGNIISEDAVKKLGLKVEPHPHPYKIVWINDATLKIRKRCLISYSVGGLVDEVQCDIVPLKGSDIILGRPWLFDRKVQHDAYANTYCLELGKHKFKLMPLW